MARELFVHKNFRNETLFMIAAANLIIQEYEEKDFRLTLRQLFYQFVARGEIPNSQKEYKRLGTIISDGRLAGLIDWDAIEDRTRRLRQLAIWENPRHILMSAAKHYREDAWIDQDERVEVWIEKDALIGVIERICDRWRVPFFSCRGYASQSSVYEAAQRHIAYPTEEVTVIHLSDHDPSGLDMTVDLMNRLDLLTSPAIVERVALTKAQVRQIKPPPNPTKITDSRAAAYISQHGHDNWELDALPPEMIEGIIEKEILNHVDTDAFDETVEHEDEQRQKLYTIAGRE